MHIKNYIKTKLQNWLLNEMIEIIDSVETKLATTNNQLEENQLIGNKRLNMQKAIKFLNNEYLSSDCNLMRIKGLELAQATTEQYARNLHKSISILLEDYYKRQGQCEAEQKLERAYLKAKKNILKNKNVKKDKQQKNNKGKSTKKPNKKKESPINAFGFSKEDFEKTFGKGLREVKIKKPTKKRGRPAK